MVLLSAVGLWVVRLVALLVVPLEALPEGLLAVAPEVVGLSEAALCVFGEKMGEQG